MKAMLAILLLLSTGLWAVAQETATNTNGKHETVREVVNPALSGSGKTDYVPLWLNSTTLGNSKIFQTGGKVGIGTTAPKVLLDVNGSINAKVSYTLGGTTFAFGPYANADAFLGFAGNNAIVGAENTGVGVQALNSNIGDNYSDGWWNTAVGTAALYSNNDSSGTGREYASWNTAIGALALYSNTRGLGNTASGGVVLYNNTTGADNTAAGDGALYDNTEGSGNTASGNVALYLNTQGNNNTASGVAALWANSTGSNNTASGYNAGDYTGDASPITGSYNTLLGASTSLSTGNLTNATAVGAYAQAAQSNSLVLGCVAGVNHCPATVSVGIGSTAPDNMLTVNGSADKPGGGSWGTYSDRRLKTLQGSFDSGLSQILKLHPVRYRYNKENALGIRDEQEHVGLVAQDVQAVIPEAVTENNKGYLLLNNDPILWSMLNAIKEQQAQIHKQQEQIKAQQAQINGQQKQNKIQQARIDRLTSHVSAIQASLEASSRTNSVVRTGEAQISTVRQ